MRRAGLVVVVASVAMGFAPAPFPKPARVDGKVRLKEFLGEWNQVGNPTVTLEVTPIRLTYHNAGGTPNAYFLTFDATKTPPSYDISRNPGATSYLGIYRVQGDTLTICYNSAQAHRPTAFDGPGKGAHTEIFKRKKP